MLRQSSTLKDRFREKRIFQHRLIVTIIMISVLSLLLLFQFFHLQIAQGTHYKTLSTTNQIDLDPITPRRGLIYDRNGVLLAKNTPVFSLMIMPSKVADLDKTISALCSFIDITPTDLEQFNKQRKAHRRFESIPLKMKLTEKEVAKFSVNRYRFPGVKIETQLLRYYPSQEIMTPVLGYVGRINEQELSQVDPANYSGTNFIGKIGLEKYYESILHGTVGYQKVETDASGETVRTLDRIAPVSGNNLYLTIDSQLQKAVTDALKGYRGAAVVIQPNTGAVLALVSSPTYDPNLFVNGISQKNYDKLQNNPAHPLYNRALRGLYPPGSVIKPFIALEGLNSGIIDNHFELFDPGWFKLPMSSHIFHDWKLGGHGWVNLNKAIVESVDTYFYYLANKMGIDRIDKILNEFGFDQPTGIDMGEELAGNIPTPAWKMQYRGRSWYPADTILSGIGQTFMQVTPMQLAVATATLANHGKHYRPHLLYAMELPSGQLVYQKPILESQITLKNNAYWNMIINAMHQVITKHVTLNFGKTPYTVAGKTGTAQVVNSAYSFNHADKIPANLRNNSVFIAFAPVKNTQVAVSVVVENTHIASQIARKILDFYFLGDKQKSPDKEPTHATP